jgi:hypothetical protein
MQRLKKLPIGIQDFESLRNNGYLYVDKTAYVYQLATTNRYYFLSRPRRFGKSMLISTLHAYFEGKKELFDGLAIAKLEKDWIKYPVLHLDLSVCEAFNFDSLESGLNCTLSQYEEVYGKDNSEKTLAERFAGIIRRAYDKAGQRVVILIDEYDKVVINDAKIADSFTELASVLKPIIGVLDSMSNYIKFAFITGVTKYSKKEIFDNIDIKDISLDAKYSAICGFTEEEIKSLLAKALANQSSSESLDSFFKSIQRYFRGYNFGHEAMTVYNPKEISIAFSKGEATLCSSEIVNPYRDKLIPEIYGTRIDNLDNIWVTQDVLNCSGNRDTFITSLFYSYGYLSVKEYDEHRQLYRLYFPNANIEHHFLGYLLAQYIDKNREFKLFVDLTEDIKSDNLDDYFVQLKKLFSYAIENQPTLPSLPYDILYLLSKLMGLYVRAEYHTSQGRIDMVVQTADHTYVMEFKLDGTAEEALQQINDKSYSLPFECDGRQIVKIGVNFSSATRNIEKWIVG